MTANPSPYAAPFHDGDIVYAVEEPQGPYVPMRILVIGWNDIYNCYTCDAESMKTGTIFPGVSCRGLISKREFFTRKLS